MILIARLVYSVVKHEPVRPREEDAGKKFNRTNEFVLATATAKRICGTLWVESCGLSSCITSWQIGGVDANGRAPQHDWSERRWPPVSSAINLCGCWNLRVPVPASSSPSSFFTSMADLYTASFLDAPFDPFLAVLEREIILVTFVVIAWGYVCFFPHNLVPAHVVPAGHV